MSSTSAEILIVEMEARVRAALSSAFLGLGYRVRTAEDGIAALNEIQFQVPDILLTEVNVVSMPGTEFLRFVRDKFPAIHVIAMSGSLSGVDRQPGIAADAFYEKSSPLERLLQLVEAMTLSKRSPILQPSV